MEPGLDAYQACGFIYYYSRDFANAAADLARVLEMQPDDPNSVIHRYLARARLGEDAGPELRANAERLTDRGFRFAAVELYLGKVSPEALTALDSAQAGCRSRYLVLAALKLAFRRFSRARLQSEQQFREHPAQPVLPRQET